MLLMRRLESEIFPMLSHVVLRTLQVAFFAVALLPSTLAQSTHHVPAQFATIQSAIAAAVSGDRIEVAPGTYVEHIDFLGKAIEVVGTGGQNATTIASGTLPGRIVTFANGESSSAILRGFRIKGPKPSFVYGGGILITGASPTIRECLIDQNLATGAGGGVRIDGGAPTIEDCILYQNTASGFGQIGGGAFFNPRGGGIAIDAGASVVVRRCVVATNEAGHTEGYGGGIDVRGASTVRIESCRIVSNGVSTQNFAAGGGVSIADATSSALLISTLLASNTLYGMASSGGGIYCLGYADLVNCTVAHNITNYEFFTGSAFSVAIPGSFKLVNCISWGNFHYDNFFDLFTPTIIPSNFSPNAVAENSFVEGGAPGATNSSSDPQFTGTTDYRLASGSPCRNTGVLFSALFGSLVSLTGAADDTLDPRIIGSAIDIGADEYPSFVAGRTGSPLDGAIGAESGALIETLAINGSAGGAPRRLSAAVGSPLALSITPPSGWGPTTYAVIIGLTSEAPTSFAYPTGILGLVPPVFGLAANTAIAATSVSLPGVASAAVTAPAPITLASSGLPFAIDLRIQGVMIDPSGSVLPTNGIDLSIQ